MATAAALVAGAFRGEVSYGDISRHGDFGVGTFDCLDGEMVAVDGEFHQLHSDGTATPVRPEQLAPFAMVTFFRGELSAPVNGPLDHRGLLARIDGLAPAEADLCAVRVDGRFGWIRMRTVSRQEPPFPTLAEACVDEVEVERTDVTGSLVGFRAPDQSDGITIGGYHFHFITDDRTAGGHVLDCRVDSGEIRVDHEGDLHVQLPPEISGG